VAKKNKEPLYDPNMSLSETIEEIRAEARKMLAQADKFEELLKYALETERRERDANGDGADRKSEGGV
jgi:hypothetical protein